MSQTAFPWNSLLYVPASAQRYVLSASRSEADAIILDLEDSVAAEKKDHARQMIPEAVSLLRSKGYAVLVRINPSLELAVSDLRASVIEGVAGLVLPKIEGASQLRLIDDMVGALERSRGLNFGATKFLLIIESATAWLKMQEIFRSCGRNVAAMLGSEDFSLTCHAEPKDDFLLLPKQQMAITARACGLTPLGFVSSIADLTGDDDELLAAASRSLSFGFGGVTCIHPKQVTAVNRAFRPDAAEVARAQEIIAAAEAARSLGDGAAQVNGRMVDAPVVARARKVLERIRS